MQLVHQVPGLLYQSVKLSVYMRGSCGLTGYYIHLPLIELCGDNIVKDRRILGLSWKDHAWWLQRKLDRHAD